MIPNGLIYEKRITITGVYVMSTILNGDGILPLSPETIRYLKFLYRFQEWTRQNFNENIEAQIVMFFFYVAQQPEPVDMQTVANATGVTKGAATRTTAKLTDEGYKDVEGFGIIKVTTDYMDKRRKLLSLTKKGYELIQSMQSSLAIPLMHLIKEAKI
jgi:DNA-binding MarR family transcriptional regulator